MRFSTPRFLATVFGLCLALPQAAGSPVTRRNETSCQKTKVVILGAGVAGVTAAQALSNASVTDFVIVERNNYIGGRVAHTTFGSKPDGSGPYTVELGANWIQGLGSPGGPENPIWTLGKKYNISNTYSNYSSILTYDETGANDYTSVLDNWEEAYEVAEANAGASLSGNLQDLSARTGLSMARWKPRKDMQAQAVEWWSWDWETSVPPEQSSFVFGVAGNNLTFNQFSDDNNFVTDQQGFNKFVIGEAHEFLTADDARLLLERVVTSVTYSEDGVTVQLDDGDECVEAEHAICTFSLGVLQNEIVEFDPPLPTWKREAIESFQMGTYTKIFFQFNETFWDPDTQFFLYADPDERGRFPVWQSLSGLGFMPRSNMIFSTVVGSQSYEVEQQSDEETKADALKVLRAMFPDKKIPEPIAFTYPRWSQEE
ncbi:hypothetical protein FJTKL_00265 [Diaporthe vaccinii]|uniref:Amine oxidase domain-containing protein n=1 Tax=Diaporthe vaccinii TaxID=105482 RepID=A0ABR4E410_9PEZI